MPCTHHAFYLITTFVLLVLMSKLDGSSKLSRMMLIMLSILCYKSYEQLLKPCPVPSLFDRLQKIECQTCKEKLFNNKKEENKEDSKKEKSD